jgi:D-alanine-D-alanine ligase
MDRTEKIRVAVLYGGRSGEHEVSLVSATNVIQNLDRSRFDVIPIGIDKQGSWFLGDDVFKQKLDTPINLQLHRDAERLLFNPEAIGKAPAPFSPPEMQRTQRIFDVIFPVIHGPLCEDGTVQGLLELTDIPYVGCGVLASAIGMDKDVSKRLAAAAGIAIPPYIAIKRALWNKDPLSYCDAITQQLRYPVFVKPANTGSSVGVHKVKQSQELLTAINDAFRYDTKVVVEQGIEGREIELAVLESLEPGAEPLVSVAGEIKPAAIHGFYSYASKYVDENGAELIVPASLPEALQRKMQQIARQIFLALECESMARVDLFLEDGTNKIYFNEINSIPGFTKISMYPKLMAASGIQYSDLLTHLITLAITRHAQKTQLSREFLPHS